MSVAVLVFLWAMAAYLLLGIARDVLVRIPARTDVLRLHMAMLTFKGFLLAWVGTLIVTSWGVA